MKTAVAEIKGVGSISISRRYDGEVPKLEGENPQAYEDRTWRERAHYDRVTRECFIPGIMLKNALDYTAAQLGVRMTGRGTKTWAGIFKSGVICADRMMLGLKMEELRGIPIYCNSKGQKGGSLDVLRKFPIIDKWGGTVSFMILNDMITEDIFRLHLIKAGQFCGLGRYAPRAGGYHGRFAVKEVLWHDEVLDVVASQESPPSEHAA